MNNENLLVIKTGTNTITQNGKSELNLEVINNIGQNIHDLNEGFSNLRTILVSSAAVTAGLQKNPNLKYILDQTSRDQVAAMVGNIALFNIWENAIGYPLAFDLPTHNDLNHEESWISLSNSVVNALNYGAMPAFNEGDARSSEELEQIINSQGGNFTRFGDNDKLASMLSVKIGRYVFTLSEQKTSLIFLTDKDGVLEDIKNPISVIREMNLTDINNLLENGIDDSNSSNGGMKSKLESAREAILGGVDVFIGNGKTKNGLLKILNRESGTYIKI